MLLLTKIIGAAGGFFVVVTVHAQSSSSVFTAQSFGSQVLHYEPTQRAGVTDAKFSYAKRILEETKAAARQDSSQLNVSDYWNITSAFVALQEPKSAIEIAFKKATSLDASSVCSYIKLLGANQLDHYIPETFLPFYQQCLQASSSPATNKSTTSPAGADPQLMALLLRIHQQDSQFRTNQPVDWTRQRPLDSQNQQMIDSLYQVYHTYLGSALVGKSLSYVMWAVVQHSNLAMMERYLPIMQQAVQSQQVETAPFKMLLDRVYTLKYGKQLFGSQVGVPLVNESTRAKVLQAYSLN